MSSDEHEIKFGILNPDGTVTNERSIKQSDIARCPHFLLMPDHYREDGTCRCNDPEHTEMGEWGYEWKDGQWR